MNLNDIVFLSDIHCTYSRIEQVTTQFPDKKIVQVGDMGLGMFNSRPKPETIPDNFYFIRGNHDDPQLCRTYKHYLGDFGYNKEMGFFYVGGAWTIDIHRRIPGMTWYRDEELSHSQAVDAIDLYSVIKPELMVTHEAPDVIADILLKKRFHGNKVYPTLTGRMLSVMLEGHKPKVWVFGHHHYDFELDHEGTKFICRDINTIFNVDPVTFGVTELLGQLPGQIWH